MTRSEFAIERYNHYLKSWSANDFLSGFKARKIDQAYRIYLHYSGIVKPYSPSVYGRAKKKN